VAPPPARRVSGSCHARPVSLAGVCSYKCSVVRNTPNRFGESVRCVCIMDVLAGVADADKGDRMIHFSECGVCHNDVRDCQCEDCVACGVTVPAHRLRWDEESGQPLCAACDGDDD